MNIILLSGGSGKRLWPLSNDIRSKQFIRMLSDEKGGFESMLGRVYRQISAVDMYRENLDSGELARYPLVLGEHILMQN